MQQAKTTPLEGCQREIGKKPSAAMTHTCHSGMAFGQAFQGFKMFKDHLLGYITYYIT